MCTNDNESSECNLMKENSKLEKHISIAMRIGVIVSAAVMIFGFVLLLITYKDNFAGFTNPSIAETLGGLITLNPYSYMLLGIFLLILTPVLRVVTCIIIFAKEKDRLYTVITLLVLLILIISFIVGLVIR